MTDLSLTVQPKSNQLNADDLIGGPRTITITRVTGRDNEEQPIAINFEGDNGKPYYPCKTMRRALIHIWKKDGTQYVGRSLTLYCDPEVAFGGLKVGGIRISHASHIDKPLTMTLTATRGQKKPYTIKPITARQQQPDKAAEGTRALIENLRACGPGKKAEVILASAEVVKQRAWLKDKRPELAAEVDAAVAELEAADDSPFAETPASAAHDAPQEPEEAAASASQPEGRADSDMGEFDPFSQAAERLISDKQAGLKRNAKDQADYEALPDHWRALVDAAEAQA